MEIIKSENSSSQVSANGQIIGKTEPVTNATSAIVNKLFIIKAKEGVDPLSIK